MSLPLETVTMFIWKVFLIMNTITKVSFFDPVYTTNKNENIPILKVHEAYGYAQIYKDDIALSFILRKEGKNPLKKLFHFFTRREMVRGLMIPKEALLNYKTENIVLCKVGDAIRIIWKDVVHLENVLIRPCHRMETIGIVHKIQDNYIVIREPKTTRISPLPRRPHAEKAEYLVMPMSLIKSISISV